MTTEQKLEQVKLILGIDNDDTSLDERITAYLTIAQNEILAWRFSYSSEKDEITEVPSEYEMTQVFAVVAGYSQSGAENQTSHSENGINRTFSFPDMIAYIRANVVPYCKVV